jgi:DNA polymerase-3 subunit beta
MIFTIKRENLLPALQIVNTVIERRQSLPILSNLLFIIEKNRISLTGTDLEVELVATIEQESNEVKETTLSARKLLDICRSLPEHASLEFLFEEDNTKIKSGKSRFTLAALNAKEFPSTEMKEAQIEFDIRQSVLKLLLEDTMFAMAQQDVRYYLNGLLLEVSNNKLKAVATDGHRLALKEISLDLDAKEEVQIIVPRKGIIELARLLHVTDDKAHVQISQNHIRVTIPQLQFTSKLIDGRFPDYERVIPEQGQQQIIADREKLRQSLNRASILSNEKYRGIGVILQKSNLKAHAHNPEQEEAEEEIEVEYNGEEMEVGFNVSYLLDALDAIKTEKVVLTIKDPSSSCLLLPEGESQCKYVVMPMRL